MSVFDTFWKKTELAEDKVIRSISLLAAAIHVAGMNVAMTTKFEAPIGGEGVLQEAKRFEKYLLSDK